MATRYKVPSQAASGNDSFSDDLVGFQITESSSLMTGTNFTIEKTIPEKDSKRFITQPFSNFLTLDDLNGETAKTTDGSTSTSNEDDIKFNNDRENADKSLFGSLKQRIGVTLTNIISKYPAAILVDSSSPIGTTKLTAERIIYDPISNITQFQVQYSFLYNPFDIALKPPQSSTIPETNNSIRNFYSSYTKYVIDLSGDTYNIVSYTAPNSENKVTLKVSGRCFNGYVGFYDDYLIRPNNGIVENFYDDLDDVERALLNRDSNPKFNAGFNIPKDSEDGKVTETVTDYVNWPLSRDGWNIQIIGLDYEYYVNEVSTLAEAVDNYKSNLIVRFLTSPQLYEFDTEEKKIEAVFQIYGQSFDRVKKFIDNIAYMRNVSYNGINNVPDVLLKNLSETLGLSTVNLFDEKTLQDSLYTRHDQQYDGVSEGINLIEAEYEFYRRLLVNLAWLYKSKGTRTAIEFFLKFIGAPEPMIKLDEYVYKVEGTLPSTTVQDDIWDAIQGSKLSNVVKYTYDAISTTDNHTDYDSRDAGFTFLYVTSGTTENPADWILSPISGILYERTGESGAWQTTAYDSSTTSYTLKEISTSTPLTRAEYPVDTNGLPRAIEYNDGSMFFQKGAGWYRKTLDHRSSDIIDEVNSDLSSRIKVIKTKSKPFTYGEDYFDVYRRLPGLDYGYNLVSEIDNTKTEIVEDESISKLTLNRKNINVFLSPDRAIDYDIYRKSRDLQVTFGSLTPQMTSGITFAEFVNDILDTITHDSHVIKYKRGYIDMLRVYSAYEQNSGFTPYNYISVSDFVNRLSPYWVQIIEQFIPATTLWTGGNLIGNGIFNRSKFKHQQPCVPSTYTNDLYPDFTTVISEDLQTLIGGGTINGVDGSSNFRGLQLFAGLSFDMILEVNGIIYSGTTGNLVPFSGFSSTAACTILTGLTGTIPLICDYTDYLTTTDPDTIEAIKTEWKQSLTGFTHDLNLIFTGATGQTIDIEFFLNTENVEQVKFTIIPHEYYGCTGYETFEYYFEPLLMLSGSNDNEPGNCELEVKVSTNYFDNIIYPNITGSTIECQLMSDVYFDVRGVGDETDTPGNGPFYVRTGCTQNGINVLPAYVPDCRYTLSNILETDKYKLIFTDAANCEQKIEFEGLQLVVIEPPEYPSSTGITSFPIVAYKPTYNYGLQWGTMIYSGSTLPTTKDELQTAITNGDIVEVTVENLVSGSTILAVELRPYSEMTSQDFINAPLSGYSFAFNYRLVTVTDIDCLTTTKISIINETFNVLPTSKLMVYTNVDLDLNTIPYRFDYKYPEDLFVEDPISGYTGDYLINEFGELIEVTGVTLNICSTDNYSTLYSQINFSDSIDGTPNILFNGNTSDGNKIVVSYINKEIDPLTFNLQQYYIDASQGIDESWSGNTIFYRDFTVVSGYTDVCAGGVMPSPTPTPSVSSSPGSSPTPSITRTPSRTPTSSIMATLTPTPSITPSISISATQTPTISISSTQTPSLSISATQTPSVSPSSSVGYTPSITPTRSITPTQTQTPSVSPTITPSITISPSSTPAAQDPSLVNFNSLTDDIATMGISGVAIGRTLSITFKYIISAIADNTWSNGDDMVQSVTYFHISTDGGSNWTEVDYVIAEVPGFSSPDSITQTKTDTYTITGTTEGITDIMVRGQYSCSTSENIMYGDIQVTIIDATVIFGGGYALVTCDNIYVASCLGTSAITCGPGVTPSVTPSVSRTPSITPSTTPPPLYYQLYRCIDGSSNYYAQSLSGGYLSSGTAVWGSVECDDDYAYVVVGSARSSVNPPPEYSGYTDIDIVSVSEFEACVDCERNPIVVPPEPPAYSTVTLVRKDSAAMCGLPIYEGDDIQTVYINDTSVEYGTSYTVYTDPPNWSVPFDGGGLYWGIAVNGETMITKTVYVDAVGSLNTWGSCVPVSPSPTPSITPTKSPGAPILIGFDLSDGSIDFSPLGPNTISIQIRATAEACQIWDNCDPVPESSADYIYRIESQQITGIVTENSASSSNRTPCTTDVQTYTFENITSGSTTFADVNVIYNLSVYCGSAYSRVYLEILGITVTSGGGNVQVNNNDKYTFSVSTPDPTPSVTPSLSVSPSRTPSRSLPGSPSRTPTVTKTPSRTPTVTPASIFVNVYNDSQDNTITNVRVDGTDVFNVTPGFPCYPGDNIIARSPRAAGVYNIVVYLGGVGIAKYATLIGSNGVNYCLNIEAGATYVSFPSVTTNATNAVYIVLHTSGSCPSPTPSLSVSSSRTPSISVSSSRTPTRTPSRSTLPVSFGIYTTLTFSDACGSSGACANGSSPNGTVYMVVPYSAPTGGQYFYTNQACTTAFVGNGDYYHVLAGSNWYAVQISSSGQQTNPTLCSTCPSPSRTPTRSVSRTPSRTPAPSTYSYEVDVYGVDNSEGAVCIGYIRTESIDNTTSLTPTRYYCYLGEVYRIISPTTYTGNITTITSLGRSTCNLAALDCSGV